ncbi:MAG: hypothetical protein RIK87_11790 [Fuerstiella sp.]
MNRRSFLGKTLKFSVGLVGGTAAAVSAGDGVFEKLLTGVDQTRGTLLERIDVVLRNANTAFRGIYHGYGLGIREILAGTDGPLPTMPERSHASWPHVHCVCHCNIVANLGPQEGTELSRFGAIADEVNQAYFSRLFYSSVLPIIWSDQLDKYDGAERVQNARRDMKYLLTYAFGRARAQRQAFVLASAVDRKNRRRLKDFKDLIFGLIDALESSWQQSDLYDNLIGRAGGLKCPRGLTTQKKREWCSGWCSNQGVATDTAEGYGTDRPWGPFHPLHPGPIPTVHDAVYGNQRPPFDPALNVPLPEFSFIRPPALEGMYRLPGPRQTLEPPAA